MEDKRQSAVDKKQKTIHVFNSQGKPIITFDSPKEAAEYVGVKSEAYVKVLCKTEEPTKSCFILSYNKELKMKVEIF